VRTRNVVESVTPFGLVEIGIVVLQIFRIIGNILSIEDWIPSGHAVDQRIVHRPEITSIAVSSTPLPGDLAPHTPRAKHLLCKAAKVVASTRIAVQVDAPVLGQELLQQQQALVHELEVVVVGPDVGVLELLAEGVALAVEPGCALGPAERHLADVIGAGVEGRIDVDEVDLAAKAIGEEVGQHLLVVAVE
jgi:hypothetical protein